MCSRLLSITALSVALAGSLGIFGLVAINPVPPLVAQDFRDRTDRSSLVTRLYDRFTDSTRVTAVLGSSARPFGLGSTVLLISTFTFPGKQAETTPPVVVLSLESWTPSRGGWAFARPRELRVERGKTRLATYPAAGYLKRPAHLFDRSRREELSFRLGGDELAALAGQSELVLKAGSAVVRLDERRMGRLRTLVREMTVLDRGRP